MKKQKQKQQFKEWYKSKTLWVNIFAFVVAVLTGITNLANTGQAITLMAVTNIFLRFITKHEIKF